MQFVILHIIFLIFLNFNISNSVIVSTSFGRLNGKENGEYHAFKHVPFARPPLGNLRFQKPENVEKWEDLRDAKEYGPACMSNSTYTKSPQKWVDEDCLHVNIFTSNRCLETKDCDVVVYIHGGDVLFDSAVMFNDDYLYETFSANDVILVIPGFRLGIFSHFVVEDQSVAPTNLAIYDILKALEFVKSEIHNFGGSNKKVTTLGHSYGGTLTSMMAFSTEINKDLSLFQRVVSMSAHQFFETLDFHIEKTQRFAKYANCLVHPKLAKRVTRRQQDLYTMKCLQKKSGMEILRIQRALEEEGFPTYGAVVLREPLFQNVKPSEFMDSPKMIPMLTGCTRIEFDHEPELLNLATVFGFDNAEEVEKKYRSDLQEGIFDRDNHTDKTQAMIVPTMMRVNKLLEKGIPTYLYEYTYPKHAKHTDDLYYIMGLHPYEEDENEVHLKTVYRNMFLNFAKFGYPGDGFEMSDIENSRYFEVYWNETTGQRPQMRDGFEKKVNDYWLKDMFEFDRKITEEKENQIKPKLRYSPYTFDFSGNYDLSYLLTSFIMIILIFLIANCIHKCCAQREKNLYIRIDGNDFETMKHI
ncbi:unnamed protein product [Caenorhabditis brenneri]